MEIPAYNVTVFNITRNIRTKRSIRVWAVLTSFAIVPIPAAIAAWRGIKWGVAIITVIGMIGLGAILVFFVSRALGESDIWHKVVELILAAFILWVGWLHVSVVFPYLRSGDRGVLFFEYGRRGTATSFGLWHNFKAAPANKRVKALALMLVAFPAGAISFLVLARMLAMITRAVPGITTPLLGIFDVTELLSAFVLCAAFGATYFLFRHGLRYLAPSAAAMRHEDQRSPVVLLRSFRDENISMRRGFAIQVLFGLAFTEMPKRLDELLEQSLHFYGPVIALGRPKEAVPSLGAAREYVSDTDWMSLVETRLREAGVIVAMLGDTEGFVWEMSAILRLSVRHKLILVVPPMLSAHQKSERWERISKALDLRFELPTNALAVSWNDGYMNVATAARMYQDVEAYHMGLAWVLNAGQQVSPVSRARGASGGSFRA